MSTITWTDEHTARSMEIWNQYQADHDLSERRGDVAGIDPATGEVWIESSAKKIAEVRDKVGLTSPLFFIRVGYDYHVRKGARR